MDIAGRPYVEVGAAAASGEDPRMVAREAAQSALSKIKKHSPSLALVFFSVKFDPTIVSKTVKEAFGATPVIGTSTAGEILDSPLSQTVVVVALASPHLKATVGVGEGVSRDWKDAVDQAVSGDLAPYFDPEQGSIWSRLNREGMGLFAMLFSPGNTKKADSRSWEIHSELIRLANGRIPIFGGASADDWHMDQNYVIVDDKAFADSMALAVVETRLRFGTALAHGFEPSGKMATVTKVEDHEVLELDKRKAAEVYAEMLGLRHQELQGKHITLETGRPTGIAERMAQYSVAVASYFTPRGGVRFSQPIPEGTGLHVMNADPHQMINAAGEAFRKALLRGNILNPALALMFSCALRKRILKERSQEEIARVRELAPDVTVAGFYSFGEQGQDDTGTNVHGNEMITTLVLGDELTEAASTALENVRLRQELEHHLQDLNAAYKNIGRLNSILQVLRAVNQMLMKEKDPEAICLNVCKELLAVKGYNGAWIALTDEKGLPFHSVSAGLEELFDEIKERLDKGEAFPCMNLAISKPGLHKLNTNSECPECVAARHKLCLLALCIRIEEEGRTYGSMTVCCSEMEIGPEEEKLIIELAGDLAFALRKLELEEELRKSEERFYKTFEASPDSITISTLADGRYVDVNQAFCKLTGWDREQVIGKTSREIGLWKNLQDRERAVRILEERGNLKDFEVIFKDREGKEINALWSAEIIEIGGVRHIISVVKDITDRKKLEAQLVHAQKMEAIGTLAGGIAHDFNNLLQAIIGYAQILKMDLQEGQRGFREIDSIEKTALRARDLTARILAFSRDVEPELKPLDLNRQIKEAQKLLARTLPKSIQLELHLSPGLKLIQADPSQLEQILLNLAVNARDAMPEGGRLVFETRNIRLDRELWDHSQRLTPKDYVLLTVTDTGEGMDKGTMERIFDPFFTTKEPGKGTGLGLAMVYGIVKNHGGHINCYSEKGKGTTFKIYFPALDLDVADARPRTSEEELPHGRGELILFVDDEEYLRNLGKEILERFGYRVMLAENGKQALEIYKERGEEISLVVLDLIMPEMDGGQCLAELLNLAPDLKVLIATGYSPNGPLEDLIAKGAKGFISKPYELNEMLRSVRDVLDE